jgi:hypothetical protein
MVSMLSWLAILSPGQALGITPRGECVDRRRVSMQPTNAEISKRPFVSEKTQLRSRMLYQVNPNEAADCPTNNQRDTPRVERASHCLRSCATIVESKMIELIQPMHSVIYARA